MSAQSPAHVPVTQLQELRDAVDVSLTALEEHCHSLESLKQDTTQTADQLLPLLMQKVAQVQAFYRGIDHLEWAVAQISESVDRMEQALCVAENTFSGTALRVPKVLSSLLPGSRKKSVPGSRLRFEAPVLFRTCQLFAAAVQDTACEEGAEVQEDEGLTPSTAPL